MAAVIATERRLRTRMPGGELVVQNVVNWRTVRGYGELWRGNAELGCGPGRKSGGWKGSNLEARGIKCETKSVIPPFFYKNRSRLNKRLSRHLQSKARFIGRRQ